MSNESVLEKSALSEQMVPENKNPLLKDRFEINFDAPLPLFDTNGAKAYEVKDHIDPQRALFALVCNDQVSPRLAYLPYMKSIDSPHILKLVEYGLITKEDGSETIALVYHKPTGPRADSFVPDSEKITPDRFKTLALSIMQACDVLKTFGLTHRAIRLDNVFYKDSSRSELVLGDCLASFPSMYQPASYETVENMLCAPQSRGNGLPEHDIYAAGAVLLALALNHNITSELSVDEQIRQKMKNGSFAFLSGNEKIHNLIGIVLRSLLDDNSENRCDYNHLSNYYEGKTTTFATDSEKSNRALIINNEKCYTRRSAAMAMLSNHDFGIEVIQSGKLLEWVKNGLENEKLYAKIEKQITADKENPDKSMLLAKLCIFLDCYLPLKYADGYIFPNGLAKTIFYNKRHNIPLTSLQSLIATDIIKLWYQEQSGLRAPSNAGEFKLYVSRNDYGYGFDRIMYDFDEDLPCISPLVGKKFVNNLSHLLKALDTFKGNYQTMPFDKNIIAYLRCKMGKKIDGILTDLNANQDAPKVSAIIRLYANIQNKNGPAQLNGLTQWLAAVAKPLIQSYHNIKYQKYLEQELLKISKSGKIIDIVEILENEEARHRDRSEFSEALKTANFLLSEKAKILSGDSKLENEARELALRFTSILAVLTMLSAFVFSLIYWMMK
jgi:serine/threonine protein kinase